MAWVNAQNLVNAAIHCNGEMQDYHERGAPVALPAIGVLL